MISGIINLSTGPVGITRQVQQALAEMPFSHRSAGFKQLYNKTTSLLCEAFNVKQTFLLTGSGTLANEVMLQEIKALDKPGLILSNGEFGKRLINQARVHKIGFVSYELPWGQQFNLNEIERMMTQRPVAWILFCHCETSTGVINQLDQLGTLAKRNNCLCFVDCMSTVGTMPLNLADVTMASASSGKGLASVPGLAVIFSNRQSCVKECSVYMDLGKYTMNEGIPFTLSSNLLKALYVSVKQKLQQGQYELIHHYGAEFFNILNRYGIVPFSNTDTRVFTLVKTGTAQPCFALNLKKKQLLLSRESAYLQKRGWSQLAMFGYYTEKQLKYVSRSLVNKC